MLALSFLLGVLLFLLSSDFWFSYVARSGASIVGPGTDSDGAVMQVSTAFLEFLLGQLGAGSGGALVLYSGAFVAGLASCAVLRQWRQLLLAPIWILPPFLVLPNVSASNFFGVRHLIFILPIYLLFVAKGIVGISAVIARYVGRSLGARRLVYVVSVVLVVGTVSWLSLTRVLAYYKDQKAEAGEVAAFLHHHSRPGDLVFQLLAFPRDALPYYTEGYGERARVRYVWFDDIEGFEPPSEVWWVLFVPPPPQNRLQVSSTPESLIGPDSDVHSFNYIAIARRRRPVADRADFWRLTVRLFFVQAQLDQPRRFGWYKDRLVQAYRMAEPPQLVSPDCPPEFSDPTGYLQAAWEQIQEGQVEEALETLQKARALHEVLYPADGELDGTMAQALHGLGDDALASGHSACASEFFSRALDAHLLALEANPGNADHWRGLANASFKTERYEDAIRAYERLVELEPGPWRYRVRLARAYRAIGKTEEAIAVLEQAIELAPGEWRPLLELGNTYLLLERTAEAVAAYQRTLEVNETIAEAHFGLALAYDAQGRTALAIDQYQTVIEIDPEHWLARQAEERLAAPNQ
jgi:tetratricopeptide (TPR) repeat protein